MKTAISKYFDIFLRVGISIKNICTAIMTDKDPTDKSKHKKVKKSKRKNDSTSNDTETKQVII